MSATPSIIFFYVWTERPRQLFWCFLRRPQACSSTAQTFGQTSKSGKLWTILQRPVRGNKCVGEDASSQSGRIGRGLLSCGENRYITAALSGTGITDLDEWSGSRLWIKIQDSTRTHRIQNQRSRSFFGFIDPGLAVRTHFETKHYKNEIEILSYFHCCWNPVVLVDSWLGWM